MRKTMLAVASHASPIASGDQLNDGHAISALAALAQPTRLAIFRLLIKHEPIGITAGASAPEVIVEEVVEAFRQRYDVSIDVVTTLEERVIFNIPREVRLARAPAEQH